MSAVCILTPLMISSWPAIASAIAGAAASMGFSVAANPAVENEPGRHSVETEIPNSEVVAGTMGRGERIVVTRDDVTVEFRQDAHGACSVCVSGAGHSDRALRAIGEEIAGRVVQQYAYHKLVSELKKRNYQLVDEQMLADQSVRLRIRA